MKTNYLNVIGATKLLVAAVVMASSAHAALINVDLAGINITNTGSGTTAFDAGNPAPGHLVAYIDQSELSNSNEATRFDWLNLGGNYDPGIIKAYNLITSSTLAQAGANVYSDGNAGGNVAGYSLTAGFTYYFTAHYGGYYAAWALTPVAGNTYQVPTNVDGIVGAGNLNGGGLSNVRVWQGGPTGKGGGDGEGVPDGGTTIACLGMALLGLGSMRRLVGSKAKA
jgi:VPDSG-CTERM motif